MTNRKYIEHDFKAVLHKSETRRLKEGLIVDTDPIRERLIMGFLDYIGVPRQEDKPDDLNSWTVDSFFASQV
jgi:hypothetical protein